MPSSPTGAASCGCYWDKTLERRSASSCPGNQHVLDVPNICRRLEWPRLSFQQALLCRHLLSCHNRTPPTRGQTTNTCFLTALEAGGPESRATRVGSWWRLSFWLVDRCLVTFSPSPHVVFALCAAVGMRPLVSLPRHVRTPALLNQNPTFMTQFNPNYLSGPYF